MISTMATSRLGIFVTQTKALVKKNLLLHRRKWISTVLLAYVFPVLIVSLLLNSKYFSPSNEQYGIGDPAPVLSLRSSLQQPGNTRDLVIVANASMGSDVTRVVQKLTQPLADLSGRVVQLNTTDQMRSHCAPNLHGVSGCHAVVTFDDSPLTPGGNATWNYTLLTDPYRMGGVFSIHQHDNYVESLWLPLQVAVDNAITNSSATLSAFGFTYRTQAEVDDDNRQSYMSFFISVFVVTFYLGFLPVLYHAVNTISTDRDLGMSHLIDAMGGGAAARVVGSSISLNIVYLPTWIVTGICKSAHPSVSALAANRDGIRSVLVLRVPRIERRHPPLLEHPHRHRYD